MSIEVAVILFIAGVILVVKAATCLSTPPAGSRKLPAFLPLLSARRLSVWPPPCRKMIVSVLAALHGKTEMAIGNAVGSVTANTGLILAVAMIFMPDRQSSGRITSNIAGC